MSLFTRKPSPPRVIGQEFGPVMTREEVLSAVAGRIHDPLFRAIGQCLMAMREQCVIQAGLEAGAERMNASAMQLGGGDACVALATILTNLQAGNVSGSVEEWFAEAKKD